MFNRLIHYTLVGLTTLILTILFAAKVFAQGYVLPYPGFMPGHPFYKISNFIDQLQEWWSFGSFAKFKYHLAMADKKLIEAKTLFEYKQYLLASQALPQYESHLRKVSFHLRQAQNESKDISEKRIVFGKAITKHKEVLEQLEKELPENFLWVPEKAQPQTIEIKRILERKIEIGRELEKEWD